MPLTFRIPPPRKWTKRGTCIIKCVYSLTLDGKRYPERQWTAKLKETIKLDNGEIRRRGEKVSILYKNGKGLYHAEWNDWACKLKEDEFIFI